MTNMREGAETPGDSRFNVDGHHLDCDCKGCHWKQRYHDMSEIAGYLRIDKTNLVNENKELVEENERLKAEVDRLKTSNPVTEAEMYARCGKCGECAYCKAIRSHIKDIREQARTKFELIPADDFPDGF